MAVEEHAVIGRGQRFRVIISLNDVKGQGFEHLDLIRRFHALLHDLHVQVLGQ